MTTQPLRIALLVVTAVTIAVVAIPQARGGTSFCATEKPEDVLKCFTQAYAERDVQAYGALFAPDYAYFYGDSSRSMGGRDTEITSITKIFNPDSVKSLSASFNKDFVVQTGSTPHTWTIRNVHCVISLDDFRKGEIQHYDVTNGGMEIHVRRVADPLPHFEIYRWWAPGIE